MPSHSATGLNAYTLAPRALAAAGDDSNARTGRARTLIESWDGTRWSVVPSPNPGTASDAFYGVFCVSATACTGVGDYSAQRTKTLIESGTASGPRRS